VFSLYSIVLYLWEIRLGHALKEILLYITLEAKSVVLSSEGIEKYRNNRKRGLSEKNF